MAIDNSSYNALEKTYFTIKTHLESTPLTREHSTLILKQEELGELLEAFDVEALEEQTKNIQALHDQLDDITAICEETIQALNTVSELPATLQKVTSNVDTIFDKIKNIVL